MGIPFNSPKMSFLLYQNGFYGSKHVQNRFSHFLRILDSSIAITYTMGSQSGLRAKSRAFSFRIAIVRQPFSTLIFDPHVV